MKIRWYIVCDRLDRDDNPRAIMDSGGTGNRRSDYRLEFNTRAAAEAYLVDAPIASNRYVRNIRVKATRRD